MELALWREYLEQLERLGETLEQLTELEREKSAAVGRGDLEAVDLAGSTLRQLEDQAPPEAQLESKRVAERLRQRYQIFQSASEVARNALECNLHAIEKAQRQQPGEPPAGARQSDFLA